MSEISWNDDMTICYGVGGLEGREFATKAMEEYLNKRGESIPGNTTVGRNKWGTWVLQIK